MLQSRTNVPLSLLIAAFALAVVSLPLTAQVPVRQKPANAVPEIIDPPLVDNQIKNDSSAKVAHSVLKKLQQIISKAPAAIGPVDEELRNLQVARRDAGMRRMVEQRTFYEEGRITVDRYFDAIARVLDAQLDMSDKPADQVPIFELIIDLVKEIENREVAMHKIGRGSVSDVEEARYRRLGYEIELLRTKRKLAKN